MKEIVVGLISRKDFGGTDEYLLVKSTKDYGQYTGHWYPPGGHLEDGESDKDALIREIREELGLHAIPLRKIAETSGDETDRIVHWWACELEQGEMKIDDKEIAGIGWFKKDEIHAMQLWPATRNFFEKFIF